MTHREGVVEFLKGIKIPANSFVIDWCCGTKPVKNYIKSEDTVFIGIDILNHVGADTVGDVSRDDFVFDNQKQGKKLSDFAFCMEGIEHVKNPMALLNNIYKNLVEYGTLYMSVPFMLDIHSDSDYWRFTDQGLALLLTEAGFTPLEIKQSAGNQGWLVTAKK